MKFLRILPIALAFAGIGVMTSCEDALDTTSKSYVFDEDHQLNSANDSLYSAMGILTCLQNIGERYVMLGEVRGDLVSVPATANIDFQNISAFQPLEESSSYLSKRDYYNIINNCNVALSRIDTSITEHGVQVMLPEYAAIRTMRDWTLLQVALIYGKVSFTENPVLTVEDAEKEFPEIGVDELVGKLITDIEPYVDCHTPDYGVIDGKQSSQFFIRPALLLADLYLYNGNYEQAASLYYKVINDMNLTVSMDNANKWTTSVRTEYEGGHDQTYLRESVAEIPYASDAKKYHPDMVNMTYNSLPQMIPAQWWINDMNAALHFHIDRWGITNISGYLEGDLRGMIVDRSGETTPSAFGYPANDLTASPVIMKYFTNGAEYTSVTNPNNPLFAQAGSGAVLTRDIALYRIPHLYLRYAEAVNRAGKPTLAFAILKYGLRGEVMEDDTKVDPDEIADEAQWTNFSDPKFNNNYGTAMRGRGLGIGVETTSYIIREGLTLEEKIEWVEEKILEEMAAETAFEGNRFFDLLRISHHRANHPAFFAKMVSRRFDNPNEIESKLLNIDNLWIK